MISQACSSTEMRVRTVAWLLVSSNRCRTIIAKRERCVSKILGDADVSVGGWWNVEKEEGEGEGKNGRWATSKKNTRRLVGKVRRWSTAQVERKMSHEEKRHVERRRRWKEEEQHGPRTT